MNYRAIALATIIGISTPAIINIAMNEPVLAQRFSYPEGTFIDKDWKITLSYDNNVYHYYGASRNGKGSINLSGAVASGTNARQVYTWNNNKTKYQVAWRPNDPNFIRVTVIYPNGKKPVNRVLARN